MKAIINIAVEIDYSKLIDSEESLNTLKKFLNISDEKVIAKVYMDNFAKSVIESHLTEGHINYNVTGDIVEVPEETEEELDLPDDTEESESVEEVDSPQNYEFNSEGLTIGAQDVSSFLQEYIAEMDAKYGEPMKIYISESNHKLLVSEFGGENESNKFVIMDVPLEVVDDGMFNFAMDFKRHGKDLIDTHYIY